jgi:hypothetical protein
MDAVEPAPPPSTPLTARAPYTPKTPSTVPRVNAADNNKELARLLVEYKLKQHITNEQLGALCGVSLKTMSRWLGHGVPASKVEEVSARLAQLVKAAPASDSKENIVEELAVVFEEMGVADASTLDAVALSKDPESGFVYVHTGYAPGQYKIGRTRDVLERMRAANSTGRYPSLRLILSVPTHDSVALERLVHGALNEDRLVNELTGQLEEVFTTPLEKIVSVLFEYRQAVARLA